jgi:hypothetical protein
MTWRTAFLARGDETARHIALHVRTCRDDRAFVQLRFQRVMCRLSILELIHR